MKILSICILLIPYISGFGQEIWSLDHCISYALKNNPGIKYGKNLAEQSKIHLLHSRYDYLPEIYGQLDHQFSSGRSLNQENYSWETSNKQQGSMGLGCELILFNGLSRFHNSKEKKCLYQSDVYKQENCKFNLTLSIIRVYHEILYLQKSIEILQTQIEKSDEELILTKELIRSGLAAKSNMYEIEARKSKENLQLHEKIVQKEHQYAKLYSILNIQDSILLIVEEGECNDNFILDSYSLSENTVDVNNFPLNKENEFLISANSHKLCMYKAGRYPTIKITGSVSSRYLKDAINPLETNLIAPTLDYSIPTQINNNQYKQLGLTLLMPLFGKLQNERNIKISKIEIENLKLKKEIAETQIKLELSSLIREINGLKAKLSISKEIESVYKKSYMAAREKYFSGLYTAFDLIQAKANYTGARMERTGIEIMLAMNIKIWELYVSFSQI